MLGFLVIRHILSTQMRLGFAFGGAFAEHHGKFRGKKSRVPPTAFMMEPAAQEVC